MKLKYIDSQGKNKYIIVSLWEFLKYSALFYLVIYIINKIAMEAWLWYQIFTN
jgi:hypothetical protein